MSRVVSTAACAALSVLILAAPAMAAVAPSRGRVETTREKNLRRVRRLLQERQVRDRLRRLGMKHEEIEGRLDRLDDVQLERLADRLDSLAVGRGALGVVLVLVVIAALVLLIIYLAQRV